MTTTLDDIDTIRASFDTVDFSGAARFFLTSDDMAAVRSQTGSGKAVIDPYVLDTVLANEFANINLVITDIDFTLADYTQIDPYIRDRFSQYFFGKTAVVMTVTATLLNTSGDRDKFSLVALYRDILRLSKAAELGIAPCIEFNGCMSQGAMMRMTLSESGDTQGAISVNIEWLVFNLFMANTLNSENGRSTEVVFQFNKAGAVAYSGRS